MSWITSDHFRPVFATSVGFVVTPSRTPQDAASRISSMSAVSRKIFTMKTSRHQRLGPDMSISAFRETSFPPGRDKLLIGPARAGGSHGGPDALAAPELPSAPDWPERLPATDSLPRPPLAGPCL